MNLIVGEKTTMLNPTEGEHTQFILAFPDVPDGRAHLSISAIDSKGCKIANGDLIADMPTGMFPFAEHSVQLTIHDAPVCPNNGPSMTINERPTVPQAKFRRGVTWGKIIHDKTRGQDAVGCHAGGVSCDGYNGDTPCTEERRVLCLNVDGSEANRFTPSFYDGWAKGNISLTRPVKGTALTSLTVANQVCVDEFGPGWRIAEHHDGGGGWGWRAYGNIRMGERFWLFVNDQSNANCFDLPTGRP